MNPWVSIWLHPRQTMRHVLQTTQPQLAVGIVAAVGVFGGAESAQGIKFVTERFHVVPVTAILLLAGVGAVLSVVGLYIGSWINRWVGSWLGGKASSAQVRMAIAWPEVTHLYFFALWIAAMMVTGGRILFERPASGDAAATTFYYILGLAGFIIGIWSIVLKCHTLGEVYQFSAWKGLLTLLLPGLLVAVPMMAAISIPNVLRGRMIASELAAVGNIRFAISSLEMFRSVKGHYPSDWQSEMYPSGDKAFAPAFLEGDLSTGKLLQGYLYRYTAKPMGCRANDCIEYGFSAMPETSASGSRSFLSDQSGLIYHCSGTTGVATKAATIDKKPAPCS